MDHQETLLLVMTAFVILAAIAMAAAAGMLFGVWKSASALEKHVARLTPKLEALAINSDAAVTEGRASMAEITGHAKEILDSTKRQLIRVESVVDDATNRLHHQLDHAEAVVDDALDRAQGAVAAVHGGLKKPIREINAVAVGVRTAVHYFMRRNRLNPDQVTMDEEMFI
jgi:hypothetical protein